jgi:hypothetical protein
MSIFSRLRAVRAILTVGVTMRAIVWGLVAGLTLVIGAVIVDHFVALGVGTRNILVVLALVAAIVTMIAFVWRDRTVRSLQRVALWIEEQHPALQYTLMTAVETNDDRIVARANAESWQRTATQRSFRVLMIPAAAAVVAAIVLLVLPRGAVARIRAPHPGDMLDRSGLRRGARASRLTPLVADVTPPAYSAQRASTLDEPADIRTLTGSAITLRGRGDASGVIAIVDKDTLRATAAGDRWAISMHVATTPSAVRLVDRDFQRIVAIEPIIDNAPTVTLAQPAHDSVLRAATGRIPLVADVNDDIGVVQANFEYIISSGEGENFTFKSGTLGAATPHSKEASLSASLVLDSLKLKPGDIVHLRAVARDANNVTGPGVGTSETRAIRIARKDEYDSVAVDAAPPTDADKSVVSERMLITLAEALEKKRPSIKHEQLVSESQSIGADQKRLRRSVGDIIFSSLGGEPKGEERSDEDSPQRAKTMGELLARADSATNLSTDPIDFAGGETPVLAVNKPLLEAYNAMWDAGSNLEIGDPTKALPFMRRALEAIQRARTAERIYLRGRPPQVVIDINKARLQGKDKGASSVRKPIAPSDSALRDRTVRFLSLVELVNHSPRAAVDSLLLLRVDALSDNPRFAAALGDAAAAIRTGKSANATTALARARRALGGAPAARDSIGRWGVFP